MIASSILSFLTAAAPFPYGCEFLDDRVDSTTIVHHADSTEAFRLMNGAECEGDGGGYSCRIESPTQSQLTICLRAVITQINKESK